MPRARAVATTPRVSVVPLDPSLREFVKAHAVVTRKTLPACLAAIADRPGGGATAADLAKLPLNVQVQEAQRGMSRTEKRDLKRLLATGPTGFARDAYSQHTMQAVLLSASRKPKTAADAIEKARASLKRPAQDLGPTPKPPRKRRRKNRKQTHTPTPHNDPMLLAKHKTTATLVNYSGPLYKRGIDINDVAQGKLGNCWLAAACAALARWLPHTIKARIVHRPSSNTYQVDFYRRTGYRPHLYEPVDVDGDLWVFTEELPELRPIYGRGDDAHGAKTMEMWFPILEKALAKHLGDDYKRLLEGNAATAFKMITGSGSEVTLLHHAGGNPDPAELFAACQAACDPAAPRPTVFGTGPDKDDYAPGTKARDEFNLYAPHGYPLVDTRNGEYRGKTVPELRFHNPWGYDHPGRKKDGWMSVEAAIEHFGTATSMYPEGQTRPRRRRRPPRRHG